MHKLMAGVHRFQTTVYRKQAPLFRRLVAGGQRPQALFVTCCDSRVVPDQIMQTDPGDLFVLRTLGNIIPPQGSGGGEAAAVEYALTALGVRDVVVCGHSHCGAMQALLDGRGPVAGPVRRWLARAETTRRLVREKYPALHGSELLAAAVGENVRMQLENLRTHPAVAAGLTMGNLNLHGWVFHFESGRVESFCPDRRRFVPLGPPGATEADAVTEAQSKCEGEQ